MRWVYITLLVVVGTAVLVTAIGALLPVAHVASQEARVEAAPRTIWSLMTNPDAFPAWRKDVRRVERLPAHDGQETWAEETSSGRITFAVERSESERLLVVRIADPDLPFGGSWTYELVPDGAATLVKITERGEVYNPLFRFIARFVIGHHGTMTAYLEALKKKAAAGEQRHGV